MDTALDQMMDMLNEYDADTAIFTEYVNKLEAVPVAALVVAPLVEVADFDDAHNVLDRAIRKKFQDERLFADYELFTDPIPTTNTMDGFLTNVKFHEEEMIQEVEPDERVIVYCCNYGKVMYPGYTEPTKVKKTNRGRKKKEKKKKPRKKQGSGEEFNSQLTFIVLSAETPMVDEVVPPDAKVYKFKVFRTGKIQLPGVHQCLIDDVVDCAHHIATIMNFHLHAGEQDISKRTVLVNVNPVMKNYKFVFKMEPNYIINLDALRDLISGTVMDPSISRVKYKRADGDIKLSIKFNTPIYQKPKKMTRINIFPRGKINILGAFCIETTRKICVYLHEVFARNPDLVVKEGLSDAPEPPWVWSTNIEPMERPLALQMALSHHAVSFTIPYVTSADYDLVMALLVKCDAEETALLERLYAAYMA